MKVVSLFSGGGGLDLGFKKAGFDIVWAIDKEINAVNTYKYNIGNHIVLGDINELNLNDIPTADILIGGPPCQSFSLSGKRDPKDPRGKLVWKYLEVLESMKPRAFVFENVTGLMSAKDEDGNSVIEALKSQFKEVGYKVFTKILNSADYGVPQKRRRVFLVGFLEIDNYEFPKPTHSAEGKGGLKKHISVKEAMSDLGPPSLKEGETSYYQSPARNSYQKLMRENATDKISHHVYPTMSELDKYICEHVKPGGNYMDIPPTVDSVRIRRLQKEGGHTTCYGRMHPDNPSYTINTYFNRPNVGCNIHYKYDRLITVREAMRLQSFPDDYQLKSKTKTARNTIVGNAVPPILAYRIALSVKEKLNG